MAEKWVIGPEVVGLSKSSQNNGHTPQNAQKATVNTITCRYWKKPGHTKEEWSKLKYVTLKRSSESTARPEAWK